MITEIEVGIVEKGESKMTLSSRVWWFGLKNITLAFTMRTVIILVLNVLILSYKCSDSTEVEMCKTWLIIWAWNLVRKSQYRNLRFT
jgi:hypothetical protein